MSEKRTVSLVSAVLFVLAGADLAPGSVDDHGGIRDERTSRSKAPPAVAHVARDDLFRSLQQGELTMAQYVLQRAISVFDLERVRDRYGRVARPQSKDATVIFRDLVARLDDLSRRERERALRILARPTNGAADPQLQGYSVAEHSPPLCNANFCVHWVDSTVDAPPLVDTTPANGVPDWVETTQLVFQQVWDFEIGQYAYRPPKSDATSSDNGGSGLLDIYLAQLADPPPAIPGLYGYCTTDDPNVFPGSTYPFFDISMFCVVDNDFSALEFPPPATSGLTALQVTAAHEFFHVIQAAYDALEDLWMLEGTATWMEDEIFDDANDNFQYFPVSALRLSTFPLDLGTLGFEYGSWVFWRFLEEYFASPTDLAAGPSFIRRVWEWADGAPGGPDQYSLQAVDAAARERGSEFRAAFADFGAVNFVPSSFYEEGAAYPSPGAKRIKISRTKPTTGVGKAKLDHLTTRYVKFVPGKGVSPKAKLRISLDLPARSQGSEATLLVMFKSGALRFLPVRLSKGGAGLRRVTFNRKRVRAVVLILTNASTRFVGCYQIATPFACSGIPVDDFRRYSYEARLVQT
jgi:hypothetical protein